jgi:hypothetical protein
MLPLTRRSVGATTLLAAIALLGASLAFATHSSGRAGASGTPHKGSMKFIVPSSVKAGSTWAERAKGYSGRNNALTFFAFKGGRCYANERGMTLAGATGVTVSVQKNHKFDVSRSFVAANPGTHNACAYLYRSASPGATQVRRATTYQVTP